MTTYVTTFKVRGAVEFPIDMLRYDSCCPDLEQDSWAINSTMSGMNDGLVTVNLRRVGNDRSWKPTDGRWTSFAWEVIPSSVRTEKMP